jgi:hypothetical protein
MRSYQGARPVPAPCDAFVLLLSERLTERGLIVRIYSVAPGRTVTLTSWPGPATLPADDPAVLAVVAALEEAQRGYTGDTGDQP